MPSLLHIEVSPSGDQSVSRSISAEFISAWKQVNPEGQITARDLNANPVPHLDGEAIFAAYTPAESHSDAMKAKVQYRNELIDEVVSADEILISTPMWNYSVPSVLKAWIDQLLDNGRMNTSTGVGLVGKKVTFVVAQGGSYKEGAPRHGWDYQTDYLRLFASSLGATDVEVVHAEFTLAGIAPGMEDLVGLKEESIAAAKDAARARAAATPSLA
jgi:FMN-dependent NADH-azoreductase